MLSYRDSAIVLRHCNLSEADKIITLLTLEHGLVRMVARGLRRTRSKFGARLEIFNSVDAILHPAKRENGLGTILSVEQIHAPSGKLGSDYEKFSAACAIIETAERLAGVEFSPAAPLMRLTINALNALAEGVRPADLIVTAYIIRAMGHSGWLPALYSCAICSTRGLYADFHIPSGGVVCPDCRPVDYCTPGQEIMVLLEAVYRGRWESVATDCPQLYVDALTLMARYMHWHVHKHVMSLTTFIARERSVVFA